MSTRLFGVFDAKSFKIYHKLNTSNTKLFTSTYSYKKQSKHKTHSMSRNAIAKMAIKAKISCFLAKQA